MPHIYIPAASADEWSQFLAQPVKHWRTGFSAKTLAHSWQDARGFPPEVKAVLRSSEAFSDIELLLAIPEHQVHLAGGSRPSQNDLWALGRSRDKLVSIAVEGKVAESFDKTLAEWLANETDGKRTRLTSICQALGLPAVLPGSIRYQLLHRTASAVIEAKRFTAAHAIMLVHSFSPQRQWFEDYIAFTRLYGYEGQADKLLYVGEHGGVHLHLAWISGDPQFLLR